MRLGSGLGASALIGAGVLGGCTSLLGTFEVSSSESGARDAASPDLDGAADGALPPLDGASPCAPPRVACNGACVILATDDDNCGTCGRSCLTGRCTNRVCQPFLLDARSDVVATTLVSSDTDLFFVTNASEIIQQPVAGGAPTPLAFSTGDVVALAPFQSFLYFAVAVTTQWDVWRATIGVKSSAVSRGFALPGRPVSLVVTPTNIHALQTGRPGLAAESFELVTCGQPGNLCRPNFDEKGTPGKRLVAGSGFVFWANQDLGAVYAVNETSTLRASVSNGEKAPDVVAWDGAALFWSTGSSGVIRHASYPGPNPKDFLETGARASDLLVDAQNVYYVVERGAADELYAVPKSGGPSSGPGIKLATAPIERITQTPLAIYWADDLGLHGVRKP